MRFFLVALPLLFFTACTPKKSGETVVLTLAVAANAQFVMEDIGTAFEQKYDVKIEQTVSSSGKLTAQILQGAPFDLFFSADMKYPEKVYQEGQAVAAPVVYALGKLVLWTNKEGIMQASGLEVLDSLTGKIALANPRNAPYGEEAVRVLEALQLYEKVKDRLVYGESIAQASQYVMAGACALGFTAESIVRSPRMQGKGHWVRIPDSLYAPIRQGVVLTRYGQEHEPEVAQAFLCFLKTDTVRTIFAAYGYGQEVTKEIK